MLESKVTEKIKRWLKKQERCYFFKVHGATSQVTGISDLIGVWRGHFVAIEVKAPESKRGMTPRQQLFQDRVKAAGGVAFEARNLATVKKELDAL